MESQLDPEHIGRIGERCFEMLCERAGLICNKSVVDVMGWDFIVEFPMDVASRSIPLDKRVNTAARVQLKSTLGRASRIRLTLSAIDRLVKDPHPALICVLLLRPDGEPQSAYLVHLIGKELARVLRRLRRAEASKDRAVNHTEITYDYERRGVRFEPTHKGLLAALRYACGNNASDYTIEKQRQLALLGYENGQFEAEALIQIQGPEHFSNLLLGLEPFKPYSVRMFDRRFGIRIPYEGTLFDDVDEFRLIPPTLGACEVAIRGTSFGSAARFNGEMFVGPPLVEPYGELLVRTADFNIRLNPLELRFESVGSIDEKEHTLEEWAELLRALTLLTKGDAALTISGNDRIPSVTCPITQPVAGPYLEELPQISAFADQWLQLLRNAGIRSKGAFRLDAFWEANEARMAADILLNQKSEAYFELPTLEIDESSPVPEGLYFNSVSFAGVGITFCVKVFFERTSNPLWQARSTRFEALEVRPRVDDLEKYGKHEATAREIALVIDPRNITTVNRKDAADAGSCS